MSVYRWVGVAGAVLLAASRAFGAVNETALEGYLGIVERNAFGLKDPPPQVTDQAAAPAPPVNITFTGLSDQLGVKKAYFRIPGKDPNTFNMLAIREGEQDGPIKVLEGGISIKEGTVKILNAGVPLTLDFDKNGNKQAGPPVVAGAAPGAAPGMAPGAMGAPQPLGVKQAAGVTHGAPVMFPAPNAAVPTTPAAQPIPQRNLRTQAAGPDDKTSYVQSQLNMEIIRATKAQEIAAGQFPPVPPTDFTSAEGN